jgi:hypothetical protein
MAGPSRAISGLMHRSKKPHFVVAGEQCSADSESFGSLRLIINSARACIAILRGRGPDGKRAYSFAGTSARGQCWWLSPEMLGQTYGHHRQDYLRNAANKIGTKPDALVVSLEEAKKRRVKKQNI